jgi:hypothetical protein
VTKSRFIILIIISILATIQLHGQALHKLQLTPDQKTVLSKARIMAQQPKSPEKSEMRKSLLQLARSTDDTRIAATAHYLIGTFDQNDKRYYRALANLKKSVRLWPDEYGDARKTATRSYIVSCYRRVLPQRILSITLVILILFLVSLVLKIKTITISRNLAVRMAGAAGAWLLICIAALAVTKIFKVPVLEEEVQGLSHLYVFVWIGFFRNTFFWLFTATTTICLACVVLLAHTGPISGWKRVGSQVILLLEVILLFALVHDITFYIDGLVALSPLVAAMSFGVENNLLLRITWFILPFSILAITVLVLYRGFKDTIETSQVTGAVQTVIVTLCSLVLFLLITADWRFSVNNTAHYYQTEIEDYIFTFPDQFVNLLQDNIDDDDNLLEFVTEETVIVEKHEFYEKRRDDVRKRGSR